MKVNNPNQVYKFFEFSQNNSGGSFDVNDKVCHRVIIEAETMEEAIKKFEPMIEDQSGSCPCCGDRWSPEYANEINLEEFKEKGYTCSVYDHVKNADKEWFKLYGKFPRLEEPKWSKSGAGFKQFEGKIYFEDIEQYCQFLANAYGWTKPDVRIFYKFRKTKEIFSEKTK